MSQWTRAECREFETSWLVDRIGHEFAGSPSRGKHCERKYGRNAGRLCPKRRKPGRWRLHCRRALLAAQYPHEIPKRDAAWLLTEIREIERQSKYLRYSDKRHATMPSEEAYWKFSRDARRYRRYLAQWWTLSAVSRVVENERTPDRWGPIFTRGRNKLIKRVQAEQVNEIRDGGTVYTFYPDATNRGQPLFTEERETQ